MKSSEKGRHHFRSDLYSIGLETKNPAEKIHRVLVKPKKIRLEEIGQLGGEIPILGGHQYGFPKRRLGIGIAVENPGSIMIVGELKAEQHMLLQRSGAMQ